jgi:hypothetical protein
MRPVSAVVHFAQEIMFADNADDMTDGVDDRQATHLVRQHQLGGFDDRGVRRDRYDLVGHEISNDHLDAPHCIKFKERIWSRLLRITLFVLQSLDLI